MTPPRRNTQTGFTLLELIIAMTLAALIVALGASILRMGMDFYHRSHEYIRQQQEVRGFLRLLRDELQGASKGALAMKGDQARLDFTTDNLPTGIGRGGQNTVFLECRENPPGQVELIHGIMVKKILPETEKTPDDAAKPGEPPKPGIAKPVTVKPEILERDTSKPEYEEEPLVHQLSQCSFSFLVLDEKDGKPKDGKPKAAWVNEWPEGKGLPLAVRIQLAPPTGNLPPVVIPLI